MGRECRRLHKGAKKVMATLLKADGTQSSLTNTELETLQKAVGGYIETVPLSVHRLLIVDEEGKLKNKPVNKKATIMLAEAWNTSHLVDIIVGDVVIADKEELQ